MHAGYAWCIHGQSTMVEWINHTFINAWLFTGWGEGAGEWVSEWVREWVSEWVSEWVVNATDCQFIFFTVHCLATGLNSFIKQWTITDSIQIYKYGVAPTVYCTTALLISCLPITDTGIIFHDIWPHTKTCTIIKHTHHKLVEGTQKYTRQLNIKYP